MEDSDPGVRVRILNAAAEAGEGAVPGLIEALEERQGRLLGLPCAARDRTRRQGGRAGTGGKTQGSPARHSAGGHSCLGRHARGRNIRPAPDCRTLRDEDAQTAATFVLAEIGKLPAGAEEQIRANAKSDDKFLSTVSLWALARVHPEDKELRRQATEQIVDRLKDQDPFVRVAAARALAAPSTRPRDHASHLGKGVERRRCHDHTSCVRRVGLAGSTAVPRMVDILERQKGVRVEVVYTLGQMGPAAAAATDALAKLVADEDVNLGDGSGRCLGENRSGRQGRRACPVRSPGPGRVSRMRPRSCLPWEESVLRRPRPSQC